MCLCMRVHIYVYVHTYVHACIYVYTYIQTHTHSGSLNNMGLNYVGPLISGFFFFSINAAVLHHPVG